MKRPLLSLLFIALSGAAVIAQLPKPSETFGFEPGADYKMASYQQMMAYYAKLDAATDRVQMIDIGKSVRGRAIKLIFISSEENMKSLDKWKDISAKLSRATIPVDEARKLSKEGKAIIWFDGGMHASEKAHAQMTPELVWRIASEESDEMRNIRNNVITLVVPLINPDGLDIVGSWYRKYVGTPFETSDPPILYQEYVGHDNNRDWFMSNMPETKAVTTVLYSHWYPQIVHNHHQTAPSWARIFIPPFRSPVNPRIHPGVTTGVNLVGTAMANRFAMKKMPGAISQTTFEMWWNGGMRTAPYYHNQIGILTETSHASPTPRFYPPDSVPRNVGGKTTDGTDIFYPYPWKGGESHFRDAVNYMLEASMAILDLAAEKRDELLFNIYLMGRDAIEDKTGAYAYVIPKNQWDAASGDNLVNVLMQGGVEVHRASASFKAGTTDYPEGSYIMYGGQAFRPFLADLLERQNYPDLFQFPGGPPIQPYDLTGWTLPMQMGVKVDKITASFIATAQKLDAKVPVVNATAKGNAGFGYAISRNDNASAKAVNRLLKAGEKLAVATAAFSDGGTNYPAGTFLVEKGSKTQNNISQIGKETGVTANGISAKPGSTKPLQKVKVGIYKSWVDNIDEGWTRWVLEQFDFDIDTLHDADIRTRNLSLYTAILLPSQRGEEIMHGHRTGEMPEEYVGGIGLPGVMALERYAANGGTLICLDQATGFAIEQFGLPVQDLTSGLSTSDFFIPGSLIRMTVDVNNPLAWGMQPEIAASFQRSRSFKKIIPQRKGEGGNENTKLVPAPDVVEVTRYASKDLLMSGWAKGQDRYLKDKSAMLNVGYGKGRVLLFGFRPQFRGQTHGTYKLLFNSIFSGATK